MSSTRELAFQTIETIGDFLDQISAESSFALLEIDFQDDGLLITDSINRHFLINYHGVTHQIWYSSALSGAHHFALKNGQWRCTRTDGSLHDLLSAEFSLICQRPISFSHFDPDAD